MSSLAAPLKRWIAQCKAYAAKKGCTYKEAMTALKKKKSGKTSYRGGGVADHAFELDGKEGFDGGMPSAPDAGGMPPSPAAGGMPDAAAAAGGMPPGPPPQGQSGGQAMFEAGAPQMGGKRRRKSSKRRRSQNRNQSHSQNGGRRRRGSRSSRRGRRQTKRGGAPLSYSAY